MANISETTYGNVTIIRRSDYKWGVVNSKGEIIVPFGKYAWIDGFDNGLARVRTEGKTDYDPRNVISTRGEELIEKMTGMNAKEREMENRKNHPEQYAKWGIINEKGEEVVAVEYDSIWKFLGKHRDSTKAFKNGIEEQISLKGLI